MVSGSILAAMGVLTTRLLVGPRRALAQQSRKMPRIGVLVSASPPHPFADAFRRGLQSFGYTEGRNIRIEFLYTEERADRAAQLAAELVLTGVDIIVAHFTPAIRAAIGATRTIPIVMAPAGAPLQLGFIASLAHPGGNVTGLSGIDAEIGGKRLQLLKQLIPDLNCVAVLSATPATNPYGVRSWRICGRRQRERAFDSSLPSSTASTTSRARSPPWRK